MPSDTLSKSRGRTAKRDPKELGIKQTRRVDSVLEKTGCLKYANFIESHPAFVFMLLLNASLRESNASGAPMFLKAGSNDGPTILKT